MGGFVAALALAYVALNLVLTARWVGPANVASTASDAVLSAAVGDVVAGQTAMRSFAAEAFEDERFARLAAEWRAATVITWDRFNYLSALQNGVLIILQVGLLGLFAWAWARHRATPGDVAFGVSAFLLIAGYLRSLPEAFRLLRRSFDELREAAAFAHAAPRAADPPSGEPLARDAAGNVGRIIFEAVTFGYPGSRAPLYYDFSLTIEPGERLALVGPTGAGKSTFLNLLTRQYDVLGGRILIDSQDLASVTRTSLRRAIAVVPQQPDLFNRTVGENIGYGRSDAKQAEIEQAAKRACAHDFILALPDGYATVVGERGCRLSGGERQRIAIARALLKDAPVLVLDEATNALDVETERLVSKAVDVLILGSAHRTGTDML